MEVVSFSIDGLSSFAGNYKSFESMLDSFEADIICFQKIKLSRDKLKKEMILLDKYFSFIHCCTSKVTSSGVATFCRKDKGTPIDASLGFPLPNYKDTDFEGRFLMTDHGDFIVFNVYFPFAGGLAKVAYKMWFCYVVQEHMEYFHSQGKKILMCCNLGFAYSKADHWDPSLSKEKSGIWSWKDHRGRSWLSVCLESGRFIDAFRHLYPEKVEFTYFPSLESKSQNQGIRLDYFIVSKILADQYLLDCKVMKHHFSNHFPIKLSLTLGQSHIPIVPPSGCSLFFDEFELKMKVDLIDSEPTMTITKKAKKEQTTEAPKSEEGKILCFHAEEPIVLFVKKNGKNKGRPFYTCRRPPGDKKSGEGKCEFFKWADDTKDFPKCMHNTASALKQVKKGKNAGKWYYTCPRPRELQCQFFKWANHLNEEKQEL